MKHKLGRKGQTEDLFSDLIIAIIIIAITITTITAYGKIAEKKAQTMGANGLYSLEEMDLVTKLRAPLIDPILIESTSQNGEVDDSSMQYEEGYAPNQESEDDAESIQEGDELIPLPNKYASMSLAELMSKIGEEDDVNYPEIFSETGLAVKRGDIYYCTEKFMDLLIKQRMHIQYEEEIPVILRLYDKENNKLFDCTRSKAYKEDDVERIITDIHIPLKNKQTVRMEVLE